MKSSKNKFHTRIALRRKGRQSIPKYKNLNNSHKLPDDNNISKNIDLSQDEISTPTTGNTLFQQSGEDISLVTQTRRHREFVFWFAIAVCFLMYTSFFIYVLRTHYFRILILHTNFAVSIGLSLIIVPSALLWGIMRSVYKEEKHEKEHSEKSSMPASEVIKIINAATKINPLT